MLKDFLFRKRRKNYTKFDFYIFWGVLFFAVIFEKPNLMWLYISLLALALICSIFIEKLKVEEGQNSFVNYTSNVPSEFVKDKNTLGNVHCVAKYFPTQHKIVVMDHPDSKIKTELRSFDVSRENVADVEKVWQDICSVFDQYTFFDTLFSYIDKNSGVLKLKFIYRTQRPKREINNEVEDYNMPPPEPVYNAEALVLSEYGDPLINIDNLDKKDNLNSKQIEDYDEFVEMDDILKPEDGKIDVNIANTEKLATLPGINIVKAKKIVEYRDKNGFFKTKDDFCKIADVKDHFIEQIKDMITVDKTSKVIVENLRIPKERIVD